MKHIFKLFTLIFIAISFLFSSCDELSNLTIGIPLDIFISTSGSNTTITESEFFCLSQYEEWRDNQEDIESVKFLEASYWTKSASPNLRGDVTITLKNQNSQIFSYTLSNVRPADYIENPVKIELTQNEIQIFDNLLSNLANMDACFTTELRVSNITGDKNTSGEYELNGQVSIVLETDVKTGN
ncbi:MAG: hypothetical protein OQJ81_09510 [Melioribacteraceae bacterium]|nr:hypothetical protein [Melioribacteraceae bacterium]